jgi:hypothetical protein
MKALEPITESNLIEFLHANTNKIEFIDGLFSMRTIKPLMIQLPNEYEDVVFKLCTSSAGLKSCQKWELTGLINWINSELGFDPFE